MVTDELRTRFRDLLEKADERHLEYEESHGDAGDAYTHTVMENRRYCIEKLEEYIQNHFNGVIDVFEMALIVQEFDEWCFDMEPGNRFSCVAPEKGVLLWSDCLEEVENQHEVSRYAEELDCTTNEVRELVREEAEKNDFCIRFTGDNFDTFLTYQVTDACWTAVLPRSWVLDQLDEIREED